MAITTASDGTTLGGAFKTRLAELFHEGGEPPVFTLLFCRDDTGWLCRDVTELWLSATDFDVDLTNSFGQAQASQVEFVFDNSPITVLETAYTTGTTLDVEARNHRFHLAQNDWISISDGENTEFRRLSAAPTYTNGALTSIPITTALSNTYPATTTEIRFVFAIIEAASILNSGQTDEFTGTLKAKLGFVGQAQEITLFQGEIVRSYPASDQQLVIQCETLMEKISRTRLNSVFEVDNRGLCTPAAPEPTNTGNGTMTVPQYQLGKLPEDPPTGEWVAVFHPSAVDDENVTVGGWQITLDGVLIESGNESPNHNGERDFLPIGSSGAKRWPLDLSENYGFSMTVEEGDVAFALNDKFKWWTKTVGRAMVLGHDWLDNTIDTTSLPALEPSHISEQFVDKFLEYTHIEPETGVSSGAFDAANLALIRLLSNDSFILRGRFRPGTPAIEIINHAVRAAGGWVFPTNDGHLKLAYYTNAFLNGGAEMTLNADATNTNDDYNVMKIETIARDIDFLKNRINIRFDLDDRSQEFVIEEASSPDEFGVIEARLLTDDFDEDDYSIHYLVDRADLTTMSVDLFNRVADPKRQFEVAVSPGALLLEVGDVVELKSRNALFAGRCFVTRVAKNPRTLECKLTVEENPFG